MFKQIHEQSHKRTIAVVLITVYSFLMITGKFRQDLFSALVHVNIILNLQKRCTSLSTDTKGTFSLSLTFL